jgi:NAD+ synthase (glutamine-hydrolysing)
VKLPRANVLAVTLPGFATSERTRRNASCLMAALRVNAREIDIRPSARQMLADLGHPYARGELDYDVTFENVQAGERTSHLFRLANFYGGLVVGTSDLSELALGYTTYGVGDHMSHYAVNASVPKTLVRHLIDWVARTGQFETEVAQTLRDILATPISPELIPGGGGESEQSAESVVGPYELQDFNLYYLSRFGFRPSKVAYLARHAWATASAGEWPQSVPPAERHEYELAAIKRWLEVFIVRFFASSQFKRSALPNGPKVGSGGSLSPRGDWRAPSDASAAAWLEDLRRNVP